MRYAAPLVILLLLAPLAQARHSPCAPTDCVSLIPTPNLPYVTGTATLDHVQVGIEVVDGLAQTHLGLVMHNAASTPIEEILTIPLPPGASITAFNLTIDDTVLSAVVQEKGTARATYETAKSQGRDAALLEQADEKAMRVSLYIPAGGNRTLQASYAEWVPLAAGSYVYRLPLSQLTLANGALDIAFHLRDRDGVTNLWSPAQPLQFPSNTGRDLTGSAHATGTLKDLVLTWQPADAWRATLIAAKAPGPGATSVQSIATLCLQSDAVVARDVVFVLDRSGSMSGAKITEAREALRAALLGIRPEDHYNVIVFDDHIEPFIQGLTAGLATEVSKDRATLAKVGARGGTDIDGALQEALRQLATAKESVRIPEIVFVTDGLPSSGVTDTHLIIQRFREANHRHAPIHVVPIGLDADAVFLTDLALASGGSVTPMDPADPLLGARLERLYDVVGRAFIGNINVTADGAQVWSEPLPALAEDTCLHIPLLADLSGDVVLHLTGLGATGAVDREFRFAPADVRVQSAVANLWGRAEVGRLLSKERVDGSNAELRKAIIVTAVLTRQLTPYTSWVIAAPAVQVQVTFSEPAGDGGGYASGPASAATMTTAATYHSASSPLLSRDADGNIDGSDIRLNQNAPGSASSASSAPQTPGLGLVVVAVALLGAALVRRKL